MIALDTNILLRYLAQDDPRQSPIATDLIERQLSSANPGFVSLIVICETAWTLRRTFKMPAAKVAEAISGLLESEQLIIDQGDILAVALREPASDLADGLIHHLGREKGCDRTVTFDADFAEIEGVERLD